MSGYFAACLREVKAISNTKIKVLAWSPEANAPFSSELTNGLEKIEKRSSFDTTQLLQLAERFQPDGVLVAGWGDKGYVATCKQLRRQGIPIISGCDNQWQGTIRQRLAAISAPVYLHQFIDVLWVSGERQRQLAKHLGYTGERCWDGFYACDWIKFSNKAARRRLENSVTTKRRSFIFVGRYTSEKGIDTLSDAYRRYCSQVEKPWDLICAGSGEEQAKLTTVGAIDLGFVQPDALPALFEEAGAFVLPSRFEPWGVVVQEAASASLPLIVSDASGAGVHLLRDGWNGRTFPASDSAQLARCMKWTHERSRSELHKMGQRSFELSKQYTPLRWAHTLLEGFARMKNEQNTSH